MELMLSTPLLLSFPDSQTQAQALAETLGLEHAAIDRHVFPDGESRLRLPAELPRRLLLYRSLHYPNDKLVELQLVTAAARAAGVQHITLVAPYLCYMRQDTAFQPGEIISQTHIGRWLAGQINALITVDPHLHRVHHLADAVPVEPALSLSAAGLLGAYIAGRCENPLLLGPDEESAQWLDQAAQAAGAEAALAHKLRRGDREVRITLPERDFSGREVVLIDDIASTGHTLAETAAAILARGARSVDAALTHALFAGDALERLRAAGIHRVWSTDSIPHPSNVIPLAPLLATALRERRLA
ncbi:phosphoribosylpyrophosphate synthetase [Thiohalobacter sp. COW1]|uniref:ribose-phosphate diphosphokinase n=1 Tax=Thiohalobacter sp. COW1 TaxID=2795687 RepID=UPI00193848C8|nr:ribose-phosphate diphosphokinase [Thiohalobacter sp. COW1]BCO33093.1 phosphoribosylpyrophosphate synthetase [Thiohalobacter sp. COW1]